LFLTIILANRRCSLDSKGVFTEGFSDLQVRLDEKFYTSVQAFSADMAVVLSEEVGFAPVTTVGGEAELDLDKVAHSSLTPEQKETKKLVKRIMRGLQPHFEEALRREADLAGRPYEKLPDLETLLNLKLQRRISALSVDSIRQTTETDETIVGQHDGQVLPDGEAEAVAAKADDMQLAPTPDDNAADPHRTAHDEAADEAAIAAQLGQDAMHASNEPQREAMDLDHAEENGHPLTPPRSEKNLLNPLGNGGIPWYMEPFDIYGTTVHEERYTGREVLRDLSEELSELDDDVLDGLADSDPVRPPDAPDSNIAEVKKAVVRKKQKRSRGW
jgi:NuA3 HAT complex component NTO1